MVRRYGDYGKKVHVMYVKFSFSLKIWSKKGSGVDWPLWASYPENRHYIEDREKRTLASEVTWLQPGVGVGVTPGPEAMLTDILFTLFHTKKPNKAPTWPELTSLHPI